MIHLHVTAGDLSRVRFAISPLWETVASLRTLGSVRPGWQLHRAWHDRITDVIIEARAGKPIPEIFFDVRAVAQIFGIDLRDGQSVAAKVA